MSRQAVQVHPRREDVGDGSNESKKPQQPRLSSVPALRRIWEIVGVATLSLDGISAGTRGCCGSARDKETRRRSRTPPPRR